MRTKEHRSHFADYINGADKYFRRDDTKLAQLLGELCPHKGEDYLNSKWKRSLDLTIGVPSSILATPVIISLATAKLIEDGHSPFFISMRSTDISEKCNKDLPVIKIRSMKPDSDLGSKANTEITRGLRAEEDPRNTPLGKLMRKYQLEELPQLYQAVLGQMTLLGIRASSKDLVDSKFQWSQKRFNKWTNAYNSSKPGLSGLFQTFGTPQKGDQDNYHLDMFYYNNANLGLDMYLILRTALRLSRLK